MSVNELISLHDREPVQPKYTEPTTVLASAYAATEEANDLLPISRRVFSETIREIVSREPSDAQAFRAVQNYLSSVENYHTNTPTRHVDLLPAGHPLKGPTDRALVASFMATDPIFIRDNIGDEIRGLVASAVAAEPNSAARKFFLTRLHMHKAAPQVLRMIDDADAAVRVEEEM